MKPKNNNGLHKAELTTQELKLLVEYYQHAIDELEKCKSPILHAILADNAERKQELESMFDGRHWNRGKGRKPKPADPGPELPIDARPHPEDCLCVDCEAAKSGIGKP